MAYLFCLKRLSVWSLLLCEQSGHDAKASSTTMTGFIVGTLFPKIRRVPDRFSGLFHTMDRHPIFHSMHSQLGMLEKIGLIGQTEQLCQMLN